MLTRGIMHSFGPDAHAGDDQPVRQESTPGTSQQDMIKGAVLARAAIMFSGKSGKPVASYITEDAAAAEEPSYGLVRAAFEVVFHELPDNLFEQYAEVRPCGKLDRYEAIGMIIGDCLGLPLMPARPQGLAVGKRAIKENGKVPAMMDKARSAARRRGEDTAAAAAAVLREAVTTLPLPSVAECIATPAAPTPEPPEPAAPEPAPAPAPLPEPAAVQPSLLQSRYGTPEPMAWGPPELDVAVDPPPENARGVAAARERLERWRHSTLAAKAVVAATQLEYTYMEIDIGRQVPEEDLECEVVRYRHALRRLKEEASHLPEEAFALEPSLADESNSMPCPYGFGRIVRWPWALHLQPLGFCCENCYCDVLEHARAKVVNTALGLGWEWPYGNVVE